MERGGLFHLRDYPNITLTVSCAAQETNWHDPQYDLLHERVELYAGEARAQLLALNDAVQYISVLAAKLRAL